MSNNKTAPTNPNLALRFSQLDKARLVELSQRLEMNQTETIRVLVRGALEILKEQDAKPHQEQPLYAAVSDNK
jgi:hypothetical protein